MKNARNILLVEDDYDDQVFFVDALHKIHPDIVCDVAYNGLHALQKLTLNANYDLIFMDLNMPLMDGFECLKELKQDVQLKHIPVIILTTSKNEDDIIRAKKLGAIMYVVKPSSFDALFEQVKRVFL